MRVWSLRAEEEEEEEGSVRHLKIALALLNTVPVRPRFCKSFGRIMNI